MTNARQSGKSRGAKRLQSLFAWGSLGLALTVATGCSHTPTTAQPQFDPLTGMPPPAPPLPGAPGGPAAGATPTAPQASSQGLPPIPTNLYATNPASIAGTTWNRPALAIEDTAGRGAPGQLTGAKGLQQTPVSPGFPSLAPNANPKVEAVPDVRSAGQNVTPAGNWQMQASAVQTANAAPGVPSIPPALPSANESSSIPSIPPVQPSAQNPTTDAISQQLRNLGVLNAKQDAVADGVHLTCYVSRGPSGGLRIYEVTAADYATAAQKILQELSSQ